MPARKRAGLRAASCLPSAARRQSLTAWKCIRAPAGARTAKETTRGRPEMPQIWRRPFDESASLWCRIVGCIRCGDDAPANCDFPTSFGRVAADFRAYALTRGNPPGVVQILLLAALRTPFARAK